jgi:hypothetical protein
MSKTDRNNAGALSRAFRVFGRRCALFCIVLAPVLPLNAQTASVSGSVLDPSRTVVSGASIHIKSDATGAERETSSGDSGTFAIPDLLPGTYQITISSPGFATASYENVLLTVGENLVLNCTLQLGSVSQAVSVQAESIPPIDLDNSQLSNLVDSRRIVSLPLVTRDPYSLVQLSPGVSQTNSALGGFAVNGSRERNNNFLLDGIDNNDTSTPGGPFGLAALTPDATQEFRVITNSFLPEYGRNTGAIVNVISRSGTNTSHGNAYWFGRYNALAARDYFNTKPNPQDPFVRNMFGWSLGGPIKKDKTFFFVNSEYQRYRTTLTQTRIVPTTDFKSGVFTFGGQPVNLRDPASPNNVLHLPLDPTMQKALALLPAPNAGAVDDIRGLYRFPSSSSTDGASLNFRLDHRFTESESLFIRYLYSGVSDPNPFHDEIAPGLGAVGLGSQSHAIATNLVSTLRPNLVNEFRAGVNRPSNRFNCGGVDQFNSIGKIDQFGKGADYSLPGIGTIGCAGLGSSDDQIRRTGTWMLTDGLSFVKGRHTFKFGGEFRYVFENGYDAFNSRAVYSFNVFPSLGQGLVNPNPSVACNAATMAGCGSVALQNLAAALLGLPSAQTQSQFFDKNGSRTPWDYYHFVQHEYAAYMQDSWRIRPNLTVNYGLRYQFAGVPFERNGLLSSLSQDPSGFAPFTFNLVGSAAAKNLYNNDPYNIEPRVGFSWDPFSHGRTAIRAGAGIFHDRAFGNLFENAAANPPFNQTLQLQTTSLSGATTLTNLPVLATVPPSATVNDGAYLRPVLIDHNFKMPVSENWNFGVQQELPWRSTLELNYVGSKGYHEFRVVNGNQPIPALVNALIATGVPAAALTGQALYSRFHTTNNTAFLQPPLLESIANSTYHSFQANFTRRFNRGMQIQAAYTWAHSIDNASDPLQAGAGDSSFPRNSFNLQAERGASDFDVRQRLVLNYIVDLPFGRGRAYLNRGVIGRALEGWELAGISLFQDGLPFDVFGYIDTEHTSLSSRPDVVGSTAIPSGADRTQTGPLVSAFAIAPFGRAGNYGRNSLVGPGVMNTDVVLSKDQSLTERVHAQLRFEFYNIFNRVQFSQPDNKLIDSGTFGFSTSTVTRPDGTSSNRQIQLALKLLF